MGAGVNELATKMRQPCTMVIRYRLRSFLIPLALYCVAAPVSAYFVWHAVNGERGLRAREIYSREIRQLVDEAKGLAAQKAALDRRIFAFRAQAVDQDILDEQARIVLGRVSAADVVVFLPKAAQP